MAMTRLTTGWQVRKPVGPFSRPDGDNQARDVLVPHDALRDETRTPDATSKSASAYYPGGAYTYLYELDVPANWRDQVVVLEFQGVYRHAMVYVNDERAGQWADGYSRFLVPIKPFLRYGQTNTIRVDTRNEQDSRWYTGAGLHRSVLLHVVDLVHIEVDGVRVTTKELDDDQAVVEVATTVANASACTETATVTTTLRDPGGERFATDAVPVTVLPGGTSVVRQRLVIENAQRWGVEHPALYAVSSSLGADGDERVTSFGLRTLQLDPTHGLRINGEPTLLRGACIHHDNGALGSAAVPRAEERRIELLKAAGFNAIRLAHNNCSVAMLEACDRHGMLVMDEAWDMWVRGKTNLDHAMEFTDSWRRELASMIAKDFNHPSVILYSIGNEIVEVGTPHGAHWARLLAEEIRRLDDTRYVTNGINAMLAVMDEISMSEVEEGLNEAMGDMDSVFNTIGTSESVDRRTHESSSVLDVVGYNYAEGRYAVDTEKFPHRVVMGAETFPSQIGTLWPMVVEHPNCIGDFTWTGMDYLGEAGLGATTYSDGTLKQGSLQREFPYLTGDCGDLDLIGRRLPVSFYREIVFGKRSEPYIAVQRPDRYGQQIIMRSPWGWSDAVGSWSWPGFEGKPVVVEVYADADEVALLVHGDEVGRAPVGRVQRKTQGDTSVEQAQRGETVDEARAESAGTTPNRRITPKVAEIETTYQPGEIVAVAYRDGVEVGRTSLTTAGQPSLVVSVDQDAIAADPDDLAFVTISLADADGVLATGDDRLVTVTVEGPAVLAGMASGVRSTEERFDSPTWRTHDGMVLAVVRPTGAGEITVTASSDGLEPAVVTVVAS